MSNWITNNFDIDLWIKLAGDHPFKFEHQRDQWLDHAITEAKPEVRARLEGLRWEMTMDLEIAKNKLHPCQSISQRLIDHLQDVKDILAGDHQPFVYNRPAQVLEFAARSAD